MVEKAPASGAGRRFCMRLLQVTTGVVVAVLLLVTTEVILRICGFGVPVAATLPCTDRGVAAYCNNQFFTTPFFPPGMLRTPRPYAIPAKKAPGTYRIFIFGESAAYGDPDPTYAFGRYLEVMLREKFPQTNFEVINTGTTATNSHAELLLAEDAAQHQPDLFIIYAGNNEVVGPYGPGTVFTPIASNRHLIRARIFLNSTRLSQLEKAIVYRQKKAEWRGPEMFLEHQVRADSSRMKPVYENFGANMRDMIAVARRSGAQVLISTVGTNLKDCAPFASLHREGLRPDELRSWNELVERGAALESAGSHAEALKLYLAAAEIDSQYAELQFRIARAEWAMGNFGEAKERFVQARDLDTLRLRADSKINDVIRGLPGNDQGVGLVDAAAVFADESAGGVTGDELFYEYAHMNPRGNYVLARALLEQIANRLPPELRRGEVSADVPSEEACERLLAFTPYDRARVAGQILSKLERPPFTNQLSHDAEVVRMKNEADASVDYQQIIAEYQWAIAQNPQDRLLHLNFGLFLHRYEPAASRQELLAAMPYDDAPVLCNWRKFN
jgi:tetratricopeptide (TPR) repeat protein